MQSHDYVPNISGWKLDKVTGEFEINSAKISVGGLPEQPQMITVTAGEWAARDLPENASEYYAFIGSEIIKIPSEYRASAKISTSDESYEPGFADIRFMLTYERPETAEELSARMKKSRSAGYSIKKEGDKFTFFHDGVPRMVLGNLDKAEEKIDTPFAVDGDQVILTQAFIDAGKIPPVGFLRTTTNAAGQTVLAGLCWSIGCAAFSANATAPKCTSDHREMKASVDAAETLGQINDLIGTAKFVDPLESVTAKIEHEVTSRAIADTQLSARIASVEARVNKGLGVADQVRDVIRKELQPGGILHRK
ncbi:Uncharacterized protein ALO80_00882 [Pseudomonas caricapapayae]|uniref:DUF1983 domain-containing protein n=1 Tax=Pseudomonas caricapapayae TaxID=46678 RepID=A0A0P9K716_9PSED|nr:hypothetical protein [Pseudomonas caricapapayae]KAA8689565.1 hypothetical protein F4W67_27455 [Pseudomonas caricapapayae]KPW56673.1 Uncharacterized protein ALO80_00882 [Pseudomonas caricapapayae]RMM09276.1 hypothetical protein ALQ84_03120 [Pseudomonas caricapapayae]